MPEPRFLLLLPRVGGARRSDYGSVAKRTASRPAEAPRELQRLRDVERSGWDSLCRSTGGAFYGALMTPDALMILVNGMVLDRSGVSASLDDSPSGRRTS